MFGKRSRTNAGFLSVMSSSTWSAPVLFISKSMARATTSRGASSPRGSWLFMNGVPSRRRRTAPSPRSASRDEEALRLRVVEARRVELVELHVRDLGARAVRHRDAVARRDVGVGRVEVDLAGPAGGEHDRAREDRHRPCRVAVVEHVGAGAHLGAAVLRERDEVDRRVLLEDADARLRARRPRAARARPRARSCRRRGRRGARCGRLRGAGRGPRRPSAPLGPCRSARRSSCSIAMRAGPSLTQISTARSWQSPAPATSVSRDVRLERVARRRGPRRCRPARTWCSTRRRCAW